jgi:hypothetical protein
MSHYDKRGARMNYVSQNNVSEVARIRASIEAECEALNNLTLFSCTGGHDIINAKYKALDAHHQELSSIVGEKEAISTVVAIYNDVVH